MLIDVTRLVGRRLKGRAVTGIDRVCLAYVQRYGREAGAVLRRGSLGLALERPAAQRLFDALLDVTLDGGAWAAALGAALLRSARGRPTAGELLLHVGHAGLEAPAYAHWVRRSTLRAVYLVHDLIPVTHPEYCRAGESRRHAARLAHMLDTGAGIIANSSATLADLAGHAAGSGRQMPPAMVAHLAGARLPAPQPRAPLQEPYFVALGTIEGRKNHLMLLQLWRRMAATMHGQAPRLVILGRRGWECEGALTLLDRCSALQPVVVEQSACTDVQLATWLRHARALLFPSFAEGFGLPLVEALAMGTPVIASNLPVFHEIAGDIPDYADPLDLPAWARLVADYTPSTSAMRCGQLRRIGGFRPPTWDHHFSRVDDFLARVVAIPASPSREPCRVC